MSRLKERWGNTPKWAKIISYIILGILGVIALGFVFGYAIKLLWNWLMPELFGLKEISYWQGIGIFILARLIFGSFGGNSNGSKSSNNKDQKSCPDEKDKTKEKQDSKGYNEEWWEKEGKKAFDDYIDRA
ncbi:MAG: hypothetical protein GXY17_00545 [Clostridiaceae bacterium]|jgi:hypothetical protein|nr:hypothetical protein [Clostridiaceae bacterium]